MQKFPERIHWISKLLENSEIRIEARLQAIERFSKNCENKQQDING